MQRNKDARFYKMMDGKREKGELYHLLRHRRGGDHARGPPRRVRRRGRGLVGAAREGGRGRGRGGRGGGGRLGGRGGSRGGG
eukprot:224763-Prymnesium_polylepis.1